MKFKGLMILLLFVMLAGCAVAPVDRYYASEPYYAAPCCPPPPCCRPAYGYGGSYGYYPGARGGHHGAGPRHHR